MDRAQIKLFKSDIERQLARIDRIYDNIDQRREVTFPNDLVYAENLAFQLHNLYSASEDLMQITAKAFENNIADLSRWHTQLVDRMTMDIEGIRPALFSEETAVYLHKLRAFRHFFRHAYAVEIDPDEVMRNLKTAEKLKPLVHRDVQNFLQQLEE